MQTTGLVTQLLKIKDQYNRLVKFIETTESAKYTIKEAVQATQELDFGEALAITFIKSKTITFQSNEHGKTRYFTNCKQFISTFSAHNCFRKKKLFYAAKTVSQGRKV